MATNFEFYKTKLISSIVEGDFCIKRDGTIGVCSETPCKECVIYKYARKGPCNKEAALEWMNAEHIERPKLTKRERAFCEVVRKGLIARDDNGRLGWFEGQIRRVNGDDGGGEWMLIGGEYSDITPFGLFEFIRWEDEKPWTVEDLLKLKVIDEVQEDA